MQQRVKMKKTKLKKPVQLALLRRFRWRLQRLARKALQAAPPAAACLRAVRPGSSYRCLLQCRFVWASTGSTHCFAPFGRALLTAGPNAGRDQPITRRSASLQDAAPRQGARLFAKPPWQRQRVPTLEGPRCVPRVPRWPQGTSRTGLAQSSSADNLWKPGIDFRWIEID